MSIEKTFPSCGWKIADMVKGYRVERVYMGFTRSEAVELFKAEVKRLNKGA